MNEWMSEKDIFWLDTKQNKTENIRIAKHQNKWKKTKRERDGYISIIIIDIIDNQREKKINLMMYDW